MTTAVISPSAISGTLTAPPSKSMAQRALALALLHPGKTLIRNAGHSDDVNAAVNAVHQFGAQVSIMPSGDLEVISIGKPVPEEMILCGESALGARLFMAIAAMSGKKVTITGKGSLMNRPMDGFTDIFSKLGVAFETTSGTLPVMIQGPYKVKNIEVDGSKGSQYVSALIIALAKVVQNETTITIKDLKSRPYLDMTLRMLCDFGYVLRQESYDRLVIVPVLRSSDNIVDISVDGDWSSAAFLLVAAAIAGEVQLAGLDAESLQGDRKILDLLRNCGALVIMRENIIQVAKSHILSSFNCDCTDTPDLFPPLAILASYAKGTSEITGIHRLHTKESDRAKSIKAMLDTLGIDALITDDKLVVQGGTVRGGVVDSFGDHRIAMAAAVAGLGSAEGVVVKNAEAVSKSYPSFFEALKSLGASVTLSHETLL